tara:strand:+ start:1136 stop:1342 length:207 start_codon:yes stop_codon:yes gene_type:complete
MSNTYGIVYGPDNIYTDVSRSLKGAKRYATINGYDKVGIRYNSGYDCSVVAIKIDKKWVKPDSEAINE